MVFLEAEGELLLQIGDGAMAPTFWTLVGDDWRRRLIPLADMPPGVNKPSLAYDSLRDRLVRFGGYGRDGTSNETWEYDGQSWIQRTDVGAPPARGRAGMAFDSARGVMVLFGGYGDEELGDLWEYDGVAWVEVNPPGDRPPARRDHSMAYDAKRKRIVMAFGRTELAPALNETWEYDGLAWIKAPPQFGVDPRADAPLAYDPIRERVYTFGGALVGAETRYWDGSFWQLVAPAASPPARAVASMAFDGTRGELVMFGGDDGVDALADTWVFDGTTWTEIGPTDDPPGRVGFGMSFDSRTEQAVVYAGWSCCGQVDYDDTWEWDGREWSEALVSLNPGKRQSNAMTFDPARGRSVTFGGYDTDINYCVERTWEYDSSAQVWTEVLGPQPPRRCHHGMVYSESHGGVLLFGGSNTGDDKNDTWLFSGGEWSELTTSNPPSVRDDFAMAYDGWRGRIVVYGGDGFSPQWKDDTWELDGTEWSQVAASGPGIRVSASMAFDERRGRSVLVGGQHRDTTDENTWEFDGTSWTPVSTVYTPDMFRWDAAAVWDSAREVVLLTGGRPEGFPSSYNDVWAYGEDADGDLRVGGYDNCPQVPNGDQFDGDDDGAGDACDCAPADPGAFDSPAEVTGLIVSGAAPTTLAWDDAAPQAGSDVLYDISAGALASLAVGPFGDASCLAESLVATSYEDSRVDPPAGDGYWYLVRAKNVCAVGTFGADRTPLEGPAICPP